MLDVGFTAGQRVLWSPAGDGKDSSTSMAGPMHHLCRSKKLLTAFHIKAAVDAAQAYGVGPAPGGACQLASWLEPGACLLPVPVPVVIQVSAVGEWSCGCFCWFAASKPGAWGSCNYHCCAAVPRPPWLHVAPSTFARTSHMCAINVRAAPCCSAVGPVGAPVPPACGAARCQERLHQ